VFLNGITNPIKDPTYLPSDRAVWFCNISIVFFQFVMARGQQKVQSQAKAAEKQAKMKKQQGHSANEQKKAAQKALIHVCTVCKVSFFSNSSVYIW